MDISKRPIKKSFLEMCNACFTRDNCFSFLQRNIFSSSTKNTKTCSNHSREASNKPKRPPGLTKSPFGTRTLTEGTILSFSG